MIMAHRRITEKLDSISHEELGIPFDEGLIWEKLESRLSPISNSFEWKWMVAAAVFFMVLFLPLTILKKESLELSDKVDHVESLKIVGTEIPFQATDAEEPLILEKGKIQQETLHLERKNIETKLATIATHTLIIEKIELKKEKKKLQFAAEDISVIQASLEQPKTERGRKMSIRAQWQTSSTKSNVEYQALKIKLNEMSISSKIRTKD